MFIQKSYRKSIVAGLVLILFVVYSCKDSKDELKTDTLKNWLVDSIVFHANTTNQIRNDYIEEVKRSINAHLDSAGTLAKFTGKFSLSNTDSLHYRLSVDVEREMHLKDSVIDPKPGCPPPGPRQFLEYADLTAQCPPNP